MQPAPDAPRSKLTRLALKSLFLQTFKSWSEDRASRLAAAFAFYAVLSLSPLLVFAVALAGSALSDIDVKTRVLREARVNFGPQTAAFLQSLISNAASPGAGYVAGVISLTFVLFGASNLFVQLEDTVNFIWRIKSTRSIVRGFFVTRAFSIAMVLVFSIAVFAWVVLDSWLGWIVKHAGIHHGWRISSIVFSFFFMLGMCAVAFRSLPRNMVAWHDVWPGAVVTALGFVVTKFILSLYFTYSSVFAVYGSAGALVVLLLWIYYMMQIFIFGLEMTCTFSHTHGSQADRTVAPSATNP